MDIEWFPVKGFEGLYEWSPITEEVRSVARQGTNGKILKWRYDSNGRPFVILCKDGKKRPFYKYMCIYSFAHQCEIPDGYDVHHIDGNFQNNDPRNMQMLTHEEHMKLHGLNEKLVIAVDEKGNVVHRFASTMEADRNGFKHSPVSAACRGCFHREGNHYYKGLRWYYI